MKRKVITVLALSLMVGAITACGKPEIDDVSAQAESLNKVTGQQLKEEQGRSIECTFEIPNKNEDSSEIHIAATVTVPESEIVQGDYEQTLISSEQIENVLLDGQKMEPIESQYSQEEWQIASDPGSDTVFKVNYRIDNGAKKSFYDNTTIQNITDIEYTKDNCPTQEMKEKLSDLAENVQELSEQFGIISKVLTASIGEKNGYYMAGVRTVPCIDDVPLVESEYGFIENSYFISNEGVSSMQLRGAYSKKNEKTVSVMSVDDMLKIVEEKTKEGEIVGWKDVTYTNITLAYYLNSGTNNFYPVWYIYAESGSPYICINAQTGELVS